MEKAESQSMDINISGKDDDGDDDAKIKQFKKKVNLFRRIIVLVDRIKNSMSVEVINTMLVLMALVVTATYQSSLSRPGGVWQGDSGIPSPNTTISNITVTNHFFPGNNNNSSKFIYGLELKKPGTTVMNPQSFSVLVLELRDLFLFNFSNGIPPLKFPSICNPFGPALFVGHLLLLLHDNLIAIYSLVTMEPLAPRYF